MRISGEHAALSVPDGWSSVSADQVPQDLQVEGLELVCVGPSAVDSFAPTLVLLCSAGVPDDPAGWVSTSMELLARGVPGFLVIDDQGWEQGTWTGSLRCGTYIMEKSSVTAVQWSCVGERTVATLTASCATREFEKQLPVFLEAAISLGEV